MVNGSFLSPSSSDSELKDGPVCHEYTNFHGAPEPGVQLRFIKLGRILGPIMKVEIVKDLSDRWLFRLFFFHNWLLTTGRKLFDKFCELCRLRLFCGLFVFELLDDLKT